MRLKIGTPCSENWDEMTPQDKGRFCQKCEKQVYDLTKADDREIIDFFRNKEEHVCGRLTRFQLNHDFYEKPVVPANSFNRYIAASFTLLALTPAAVAQNTDLNITTPVEISKNNIQYQEIQGGIEIIHDFTLKLLDQNGQPLKKAWITFHGRTEKYQTNDLGMVEFNFPIGVKEDEITANVHVDFRYGEILLKRPDLPIHKEIRVELHEEILMGDIAPIEEAPTKIEKPCKTKK